MTATNGGHCEPLFLFGSSTSKTWHMMMNEKFLRYELARLGAKDWERKEFNSGLDKFTMVGVGFEDWRVASRYTTDEALLEDVKEKIAKARAHTEHEPVPYKRPHGAEALA